jgi:oxygen-independent coproporphyrinogen-3 oxidase
MTTLQAARDQGFRSISIDLIYGLSFQTAESFQKTLERIIEVDPDRLSIFNYAHLPQLFMPQRRIDEEDLPSPQEKLDILKMTIEVLTSAGYLFIGMDHFAKPDDELARAQRDGTLYRNFQGYSTHSSCDLVAMGVTSIGMVGPTYSQNVRTIEEYSERIDGGQFPIFRGIELSRDDEIRRDVITRLICHFALDYAAVESRWDMVFSDYFSSELEQLAEMAGDGLLELDDAGIRVLPRGRLLIRNICMAFDRYLAAKREQKNFSRVI